MSASEIEYRDATRTDLPAIIAMLADDTLGQSREDASDPPNAKYVAAFDALETDANQRLIVVEQSGSIIGCFQISFIPGLSRLGMWRGQIESVRIASSYRGKGLGRQMMEWAIAACGDRGCELVQLTSDKTRTDAHRFYDSLGFVASHDGYKLSL